MKPVVQEEKTGCGIASSAAIAGISYTEAKRVANSIGIYAEDQSLWSNPQHVRDLLAKLGIDTEKKEIPFNGWASLPDCALISTKWHMENGKPYWHWAVFVREGDKQYVLDSKKSLKMNTRTDFGRIKPKWYIKVIV
jgi:ABC-type bacteriocin/lantibiotic exporter with double-glycine peptidase domain